MNLLSCNCQWALKQDGVHFVLCPKQGNKVEDIFPCRICILGFFCPKQSQGFKPSEAQLYPNTGRVPPGGMANFITCLLPEIPRKNCFYPIHPKARAKMAVS